MVVGEGEVLPLPAPDHEDPVLVVVPIQYSRQGGPRRLWYMQEYDMQVILLLLFHAQPP